MSAVEELRTAAAKLREMAAKASSQGAWRHDRMSVQAVDRPIAMAYQCYADAAWIALMHPGVAEPLAEWLEAEAHMWDLRGNSAEGQTFHALKVARVINGGEAR